MPLFRSAVESSPTGILVCDDAGAITFVNQQICSIFGHAPDALLGRSVEDLVPSAFRIASDCSLEPASTGSSGLRAVRELPARGRDGSELKVQVGWTVVETGER